MRALRLAHIGSVEINSVGELVANLVEGTSRPVTKPVQHTPAGGRGEGGGGGGGGGSYTMLQTGEESACGKPVKEGR